VSKPWQNYLKTAAKFLITAAALYCVFSRIEFSEVLDVYRRVRPGLLAPAILLFALSKTIAAFRLNRFFHAADITPGQAANLRLYLLGMFYNLFLPGGIGGDGYKIYLLNKKYRQGVKITFTAVLADRLSGMFALALLVVAFFPFIPLNLQWQFYAWILIPAGVLLFRWIWKLFFASFIRLFWFTSLYSLGVQAVQVLCAWVLLTALGQQEQLISYLFVFLISSIVAVLPVTIGGVGARELTFLYGARLLGLDPGISIALSLMFYFITAFVSLWGIWFVIKPISALQPEETND
jgi:glycosyltransferase 2 family protein